MPFKTILVALNQEARLPTLLSVAGYIARDTGAHVIGLYVYPPIILPGDVMLVAGHKIYEDMVKGHREQAERVKAAFEEITKGAPYPVEWRTHGDLATAYEYVADGVIAEARGADLVIVSQALSGSGRPAENLAMSEIPERVTTECGRPVLVVPRDWEPKPFSETVAIAWDNSRESSRAVFDLMPLLEQAKRVHVVTVEEWLERDGSNTIPGADIGASLSRYGCQVEVERVPRNGKSVGEALLDRTAVHGAGMLVMGAYGHSRMRELILGGATRHVLKSMSVPVLMSH